MVDEVSSTGDGQQTQKPLPKSRRKSWNWAFSVLRIGLVLLIMLSLFQRSLIYHPRKAPRLAAKDCEIPQATVDAEVKTFDNLTLHGWLTFAETTRTSTPVEVSAELSKGRPLVVVFPGNAGNRANRGYLLEELGRSGADALIFDYRDYGDNQGSPTESNFAQDARSIWKYVTEDLHVSPNRIVLYGESLGGGTACRLAGSLGSEGIEPGGLILQSTFNSLVDTGRYHFPYLPVSLILIDRFESQKHIVNAKCPVLQLHGMQDDIVPLKLGQRLFEAAPNVSASGVPKQQVLLPNANHNDVYLVDSMLARKALAAFLRRVSDSSTAATVITDKASP